MDTPELDDFDAATFELDFCTALNMMLGMNHREAVEEAKEWVKEAKD